MMTNDTQPLRQCRERVFALLVENDPDPKIYPISPPPEGFVVVCVWDHEDGQAVGTLEEFEKLASSYPDTLRCLYLTVPVAVAEDALRG